MTWVRYTLPAAAIVSAASPAYAVRYLSIEEARKEAFPSATNFSEVQAGRVWKAEAGGKAVGFFVFDRVVGKHHAIFAIDCNRRALQHIPGRVMIEEFPNRIPAADV